MKRKKKKKKVFWSYCLVFFFFSIIVFPHHHHHHYPHTQKRPYIPGIIVQHNCNHHAFGPRAQQLILVPCWLVLVNRLSMRSRATLVTSNKKKKTNQPTNDNSNGSSSTNGNSSTSSSLTMRIVMYLRLTHPSFASGVLGLFVPCFPCFPYFPYFPCFPYFPLLLLTHMHRRVGGQLNEPPSTHSFTSYSVCCMQNCMCRFYTLGVNFLTVA